MSDLKQTIKKSLIILVSVSVVWFLWELINAKDLYAAAKSAVELLLIASLGMIVAEAAYFYQTKKFI